MCAKDQLCVKHAKFLSPFLSINHQCTKKHKARVFIIRYCIIVKTLFFFGGGEVGGFGGEASKDMHYRNAIVCLHNYNSYSYNYMEC